MWWTGVRLPGREGGRDSADLNEGARARNPSGGGPLG